MSVLLCCSVVAVTAQQKPRLAAQKQAEEAWWLTTKFTPSDTTYDGLPATAIDPDWSKFTLLTYDKLPASSKDDLSWMKRDGFVFHLETKSKQTRTITRDLVGVYQTRQGEQGRFVLVIEKASAAPNSPWKVAFLHKEKGDPGFSTLARRSSGLYWGTCLQCDEFQKVVKKGKSYQLDSSSAAP